MSHLKLFLAPVPLIIFLFLIQTKRIHFADWFFWQGINDFANYPVLIPTFLRFIYDFIDPKIFLFILFTLLIILIPYFTILKLKNFHLAIFYLYFSSIPFHMFDGGFVAQWFVISFISLSFINPFFFALNIIFLPLFHREGMIALLVLLLFNILRDYYARKNILSHI